MLPRGLPWALGFLLLGGCVYPVREQADQAVCDMANHPMDPEPLPIPAAWQPLPPAQQPYSSEAPTRESTGTATIRPAVFEAPVEAERPPSPPLKGLLQIPPELPGANAPLPRFPPAEPRYQGERERIINQIFPPLPDLGQDPQPLPGPLGHPYTLADLLRLAQTNSPLLRQAAADVEAARGAARQAGAYPNPNFGYEADTAGDGGTAGFQGVFFEQTIRTAGKLKLAEAAALMDLKNSEIALRRAQMDLATQVRAAYFAVLVAQENVKVARALARVTDQAYAIQMLQFRKGGITAAYEPMQLRVYAYQARGTLVQARNSYAAAWKQLAAALGLPALPPTELAGRSDMPVPTFQWQKALAQVLNGHTDVLSARVLEQRARYNLLAAQVTPIPDVSIHLAVQKDCTTPPHSIVTSLQMGVPVPIWDQNQGAIVQAQGQLLRAVEESHRVRDDLSARLADAFQRYQSNLVLLDYYRTSILPDQVRYYRGVYERYGQDVNVSFTDLIVAQQSLGTAVATYLTTLGALWTAVSDVANLLQTDDLWGMGREHCVGPVPDLDQLLALPCCHPCSPLPDPALKGGDGRWQATAPEQQQTSGQPTAPGKGTERTPAPTLPLPARDSNRTQPLGFETDPPEFTVPVLDHTRPDDPAPPGAPPEAGGHDEPRWKMPAMLPPVELPALPVPRPSAEPTR